MIGRLRVEHLLFFLSGVVGLSLEVLWLRELGLLMGNTAYATGTVLAVFFLGFGLGGHLWGRAAPRFDSPLMAYGGLEGGVALSSLLLPLLRDPYLDLYPALFQLTGGGGADLMAVKAGSAALVLLVPAILMGGTFPVMAQHLVRRPGQLGDEGSLLYGTNVLGGVLGALLAGFLLPRSVGYRTTYVAVVLLAALVAAGAGLLYLRRASAGGGGAAAVSPEARSDGNATVRTPALGTEDAPQSSRRMAALLATLAFVSGLGALGLEVLWSRMLTQVLQNSVYSVSLVLALFIACLGLGALVASRLARAEWDARSVLGWLLLSAGTTVLLSGRAFVSLTDGLEYLAVPGWTSYLATVVGLTAAVLTLPGVLVGTVFPYLLELVDREWPGQPGRRAGFLVAANSAGAVMGAVVAGVVLLDAVGLWTSLDLVAYLYLIAAALVFALASGLGPVLRATPAAILLAAVLVLEPADLPAVYAGPDERVLEVWHGSQATVAVLEEGENRKLKANNHYTAGDTRSAGTERMQGHLPLLLRPQPDSVFFLGLGTGITAGAALEHPVRSLTAAEVVPEVVTAAREYFAPYTNGLFSDPRARIIAEDGRNYLLATPARYGVVIGDLYVPWHVGAASLYSLEHFRSVRRRLRPGGLFVQWLPLYQLSRREFLMVARTMARAFPRVTVWRGNFSPVRPVIALAGRKEGELIQPAVFARRANRLWKLSEVQDDSWRALAGIFYAGTLRRGSRLFDGIPMNTVDRPRVQFSAPVSERQHRIGGGTRLVGRELETLYRDLLSVSPGSPEPFVSRLPPSARDAPRAGLAYYRYRLFSETGSQERANAALEDFDRLAPTGLRALVRRLTGTP